MSPSRPHDRDPTDVRGVLLDLDGTLYQEGRAIAGASRTVETLRSAGIPILFLTNTTRLPRTALVERLSRYEIPACEEEILTALGAAVSWLEKRDVRRVHLVLPTEARSEFRGFDLEARNPEAVVVGDLGDRWDFQVLNRAFRHLHDGAILVALQKNRYWKDVDGLSLDAGPFVAALEYAADTRAEVIGKPSHAFFQAAAESLGLDLVDLVMVGDDIESDIGGAQRAGARGVLVRTGKFRRKIMEASDVVPDIVLDSVLDLPAHLGL